MKKIDKIAKDIELLNVVAIFKRRIGTDTKVTLQTVSNYPFNLKPKTKYRLKVTIFSKNAKPVSKNFELYWDGTWDGFTTDSITVVE